MAARVDYYLSFVWILLGTAICQQAVALGLSDAFGPGSGFFPLIAGATMAVSGVVLALSKGSRLTNGSRLWPDAGAALRVGICIALLVLLVAMMPYIGFLTSALIVTPLIVRLVGGSTWRSALLTGCGASVLITLLFTKLLSTALPAGILKGWL